MFVARMWTRRVALAAVAALSVMACERGSAAQASVTMRTAPARDADGEPPGTDRESIKRTVAEVTADVNRILAADAAGQRRLLPAHTRAVNGMLSRFETKVRAMHVSVDPDWVAVIDSVQSDLARMPAMSPAELHAFMPGHTRRVMRIVACVDMVRGG
ncbi:MAG TPA: hypothetical protein VF041_05065 [Gemmatimonadaceae bacterium]